MLEKGSATSVIKGLFGMTPPATATWWPVAHRIGGPQYLRLGYGQCQISRMALAVEQDDAMAQADEQQSRKGSLQRRAEQCGWKTAERLVWCLCSELKYDRMEMIWYSKRHRYK